jgi:hypothetical protein
MESQCVPLACSMQYAVCCMLYAVCCMNPGARSTYEVSSEKTEGLECNFALNLFSSKTGSVSSINGMVKIPDRGLAYR